MSEVVVIDEDIERKMKEAMSTLNKTLQGKDYQTLLDYSKEVRDGKIFIDSCPNFSNSAGGARKKGRRVTRKKGGVGKGKRADGAADAPDTPAAPPSPVPPFDPGFSAETVPPVNTWDSYDYAAATYLIVISGGIQYLGGFATIINAAGDAIAEVGGIPTQEEACAPLNMLRNAELGSVMTGMMSCEEVQKRYVAIVVGMVTALGACISTTVGANANKVFANVNWSNPGQIVMALGLAGHTILADGLRKRALGFPTISGMCNQLRKIITSWGAPGSNKAKLSPSAGTSAAEEPILDDSITPLMCGDVSGSSGGRRRRRRRVTKKRRKQKGKRKYKTKKR